LVAAGSKLLFRRTEAFIGLAQTVAAEQKNLGVLHQAVGDGGGNGGVVQNVAPVREWRVGRDDGGFLLAMPGGDYLLKEIGRLLIEGQVT